MYKSILLASALTAAVSGQQAGTNTPEVHPSLPVQVCTASGCTTKATKITLDANWRWLHTNTGYTNCYTGQDWNATLCPDGKTCATNCALDGADYASTYGITTSGSSLSLEFVTKGAQSTSANVGSRVYLMDTDTTYNMFSLKNQEFTFDVDVSKLPCGLNGALYFVEMDKDGGTAKFPTNKAGAKYGTGYCDTQCPHDVKFINGEANIEGWSGSPSDPNSGAGKYGACCPEMDIWEANSVSAAYTPHTCKSQGLVRCANPTDCGDGDSRYSSICDKDGCDFNSYRMGNTSFYGPAKTIDTTKVFTVVTQFITAGNTATGDLVEIRRKYVQNGVVIENSVSNIAGVAGNSISDTFCNAQKSAFGDQTAYQKLGGTAGMGKSIGSGMVLALSIWDDHAANMLWLDSTYPIDSTKVGAARGTCATDSGKPEVVEKDAADSVVTFSNIKYGAIGSTFKAGQTTPGTPGTPTPPAPSGGAGTVEKYGKCGGQGYTGATACVAGSTCTKLNDFYSQCL